MKNDNLSYSVTPFDPSGHRLKITLQLKNPNPEGQEFFMPSWIPGSYLIRDFGRQVETISANCLGSTVNITKTGNSTWLCDPCNGTLNLEYVVYAWDLSVRSAHVDESHAFFNGTSVFLGATGHTDSPCQVLLCPPPHTNDWQVYTSMALAENHPQAAQRHGFGLYYAPNYDDLIDHPVEMGTPQLITFYACGVLHEMVFTGVIPNLDLERIALDTKKICEAQIKLFDPEENKAPFLDSSDRYVFMTIVTGDGYGGLEHRASTALVTSRNSLPVLGDHSVPASYVDFLGLVSHEYFHTWNVKRIKPAAFAPYHLTRENHTELLWVFEGFTSYYDDLMVYRSGAIDGETYFKNLGKMIGIVHQTPGRLKQSVAESSFDTWTRFYKQDENSPNALVSYYSKGALVALGLDLTIRKASNNTRSLDDVMRFMWNKYGRDFYKPGAGRSNLGVNETEMPELIMQATGVDTTEFIQQYAYGRADVPLKDLLSNEQVDLSKAKPKNLPSLDARIKSGHNSLSITTAYEGGAAHKGGLSAGDEIVAIAGLRVTDNASLNHILSRWQAGSTVEVHVFRRDELRCFNVVLAAPAQNEYVLTNMAKNGLNWPAPLTQP